MFLSAVQCNGLLTHWVMEGQGEKYPSFYSTKEDVIQIGCNLEKIRIINVIFSVTVNAMQKNGIFGQKSQWFYTFCIFQKQHSLFIEGIFLSKMYLLFLCGCTGIMVTEYSMLCLHSCIPCAG